jgi:ferric-dicitrate binding protein FerR (iron transport regulator)
MIKDYHILVAKYLGGECTKEEREELDQWLSASKENDDYFIEVAMLYERADLVQKPMPNLENAKSVIHNHITQSSQKPDIKINSNKNKVFKPKIWWSIAAGLTILLSLSLGYGLYFANEKQYVYATSIKQIKEVLPDSTKIILSKNSRLTYNSNKHDNKKYVNLEGKAFFEINKNSSGKFVVCTEDKIFIKDIGTAFTVESYKNSSLVTVSVKSGEVNFYTTTDKGIILKENEVGTYNKKTNKFSIIKLDKVGKQTKTPDVEHSGIVVKCGEMTLGRLINQLNDRFDSKVKLTDSEIGNEKITVQFDGTESLDLILEVISQTMELNIDKKGDECILSKRN